MIFCGQCGLQLAPGSTRCPRCGATIDPTATAVAEELHTDDPTVASQSVQGGRTPRPSQVQNNGPQPLILRSGVDHGNYEEAYDATRMMENPTMMQTGHPMNNSYAGYPPQGSYADYGTQAQGQYISGQNYPSMHPQMDMGYADQYHHEQSAANARGRTTGLVFIVLGLLFILSAVALFALQQGLFGVTI